MQVQYIIAVHHRAACFKASLLRTVLFSYRLTPCRPSQQRFRSMNLHQSCKVGGFGRSLDHGPTSQFPPTNEHEIGTWRPATSRSIKEHEQFARRRITSQRFSICLMLDRLSMHMQRPLHTPKPPWCFGCQIYHGTHHRLNCLHRHRPNVTEPLVLAFHPHFLPLRLCQYAGTRDLTPKAPLTRYHRIRAPSRGERAQTETSKILAFATTGPQEQKHDRH